ncbi:hypothetical protein [Desulfoluna butyratoxydans]|uniref:Porin domain-containing protein n=1 Tax=Desulfoluna butyratoxydans TaxID=231438 RepID=A0A4U8YJL6_9BACT|nr:hypothetical protein [Desulfoluna butyratoxydans]VFQ43966.1 hypothetical protein MSL71_16100 [Desulfoluna butyratoxydans]
MFKKVFAAMLAGLFISAPAFAEVKMSGSFFIKGNANQSASKKIDNYSYYESDFEVKTDFIVDETTSAKLVVEAFDENWTSSSAANSDTIGVTTGVSQAADKTVSTTSGTAVSGEAQNHLQVTTATLTHKFATGTSFTGGVSGNRDSWGTLFGDDADKNYFVQIDQALSFGTLVLKNEKIEENELTDDNLDEDGYLLGLKTKAGGFDIMPAVYYRDNQKDDKTEARFMVAATGKLGAFSIESEFGYADFSDDKIDANEGSVFGAWVDAGTTVAGLSINAGILYSGTDDAVVYNVGDELCPMEILGDDILIDGASLVRVKVAKAITEKVGVDFSAAYTMTNLDDDYKTATVVDDDGDVSFKYAFDKAYEFDANAFYKATDAVTLSCGIAYLDGDYADDSSFPQARIDSYAKINVAF